MNTLRYQRARQVIGHWQGEEGEIQTLPDSIRQTLQNLQSRCVLLDYDDQIAVTKNGRLIKGDPSQSGITVVAEISPIQPENFGDPEFLNRYGVQRAYMAGAMANAISGTEFVIALGRAGYLASFGAGGVSPDKLRQAVETIQKALPDGPYGFNLIHSPQEAALEQSAVDIYLENRVRVIEASAYLRLTPPVVQFRAAGLKEDPDGQIQAENRIIAKLSRPEVAQQFLRPAPEKILQKLVQEGKITERQAELAGQVPMADDITVEADSGGHTDNRPLVGLLPSITALRDEIQREYTYPGPVCIGAGGGIGTPAAVLGAFAMGAAYVVTGSVNQASLEANTSAGVKQALAQAGAPDVMMAPAADMFEMGVKVQVLKRGTMFPMRSQKLYDVYREYDSVESIPADLRKDLETKIFQKNLDAVWTECVRFFEVRDPEQLEKAQANPKKKMALIFRWYLGLATHWGIQGLPERRLDYQVWCGPAMGAFNDWARGTDLEKVENRSAVTIADQLLLEAAYLQRLNQLRLQGISAPISWRRYLG